MDATPLETVRKMAELARLDVSDKEAEALARDFTSTLAHFRVLSELDLGAHASGTADSSARNTVGGRLRQDLPRPALRPEQALANAPERVDDFYRVPKTVGGAE